MKPSRHQFAMLKQIVEHIPANLVPKLARKHGVTRAKDNMAFEIVGQHMCGQIKKS